MTPIQLEEALKCYNRLKDLKATQKYLNDRHFTVPCNIQVTASSSYTVYIKSQYVAEMIQKQIKHKTKVLRDFGVNYG